MALLLAIVLLLAASVGPLISFLIWLVVFVIVVYLAWLLVGVLPLPAPWKTIVWVLVCLILLLIFLQQTGLLNLG